MAWIPLMAASGLWNLYLHFLAREAVFPITRLLQSVLSVVSAGTVFYLTARSYRGQSVGQYPMGALAPGYTFCLWLTASYQSRAADPVVQYMTIDGLEKTISRTKKAMQDAAKRLDFLEAAQLRDELIKLEELLKERRGK